MGMNTSDYSLGSLLEYGQDIFKKSGINTREAKDLLLATYHLDLAAYLYRINDPLDDDDLAKQYLQAIGKRLEGLPIAYILGYKNFYGYNIKVSPSTLIPRPETELLVEKALSLLEEPAYRDRTPIKILDMCTGTACIPIAICMEKEEPYIDAVDISKEALEVARENIGKFDLKKRINLIRSDLFKQIGAGKYDMIISNPPYINHDDYEKLDKIVKDKEPKLALYGGESGLDFYRLIIGQAGKYLKKNAYILLEIGYNQAKDIYSILAYYGFKEIKIIKDYNKNDRIAVAIWTK